jgi:hypothetical protein
MARPRFTPGKGPPVAIGQEAGWASELVWTERLEEKSFASAEDRTPVVHSVVRHYTEWGTPAADSKQCTCLNHLLKPVTES